jgi:hypothetical protein
MAGIAYRMPFELEQSGLFHISLHIDARLDTNKEGWPSKDSSGHMFFVLQAFLPSEQNWAYKWLFQNVSPVLGRNILNKLSLPVTDGDSQEITQYQDAVNKYFPSVYHIQCSWHIIDRGWHKKVKVSLGGHARRKRRLHLKGKTGQTSPPLTELNKTARTIYRWIFSWAWPSYCETEEECVVSKALFMKFVQFNQVKELFGLIFVESVVLFVRENVFPHEECFCCFKRHALLHLETHTNCGQKGTNNGVKNSSSPVMPQSRLIQTIKTLNLDAKIKTKNTSIMVCSKTNRAKLWSDLPIFAHVTNPCESMLKMEWKHVADWISHCVSEWRWLVIHCLGLVQSSMNYWSNEETDSDEVNLNEEELDVESPPHDSLDHFLAFPESTKSRQVVTLTCSCVPVVTKKEWECLVNI